MYNLIRMSILKLTSIDSWEIMKKILINSPNNLHLHYDRGAHETSERWFFFTMSVWCHSVISFFLWIIFTEIKFSSLCLLAWWSYRRFHGFLSRNSKWLALSSTCCCTYSMHRASLLRFNCSFWNKKNLCPNNNTEILVNFSLSWFALRGVTRY